jgi:hypothetical protein
VEDLYVRREKKNWILGNIRKLTGGGKLKFSDLGLDPALVALKQQLASYVFFLAAFEHHYSFEDCICLTSRVVRGGEPPEYALKLEILRSKRDLLKEYEESQFMDAASLTELTQIYELLLLVSINRLLRKELEPNDARLFKIIRNELPLYESFRAIDTL